MNKEDYLVSILIPVYGVEKYIERCAVSLFEQTYQNIEYIFVDDCSPDNSIPLLKKVIGKYPQRANGIKIIRHERNRGLAAARNTAVAHATGKYVMHVDSDDFLELDTVEKTIKKIVADKADAVVFGFRHVFKSYTFVDHVSVPESVEEYVESLIRREAPLCVCGGLYLRSLYVDYGVEAIEGLNMGEDYATKPRLMYYAKKVVALDEPLYNYFHVNEGSYTSNFSERHIDDMQKAISVLEQFFMAKCNTAEMRNCLLVAKSKVKAELLIDWGLHGGNHDAWERIHKIQSDMFSNHIHPQYKLMLLLDKFYLCTLIRMYSKMGVFLKSCYKYFR